MKFQSSVRRGHMSLNRGLRQPGGWPASWHAEVRLADQPDWRQMAVDYYEFNSRKFRDTIPRRLKDTVRTIPPVACSRSSGARLRSGVLSRNPVKLRSGPSPGGSAGTDLKQVILVRSAARAAGPRRSGPGRPLGTPDVGERSAPREQPL